MCINHISHPKIFFCNKCKVYFFTNSQIEKPTHSKCHFHQTRRITKEELDDINRVNKTNYSGDFIKYE